MEAPVGQKDGDDEVRGRRAMRRNIRDLVLGEHLLRVRARREDLRRILGGGAALVVPTLQEKQAFQDEYVRLGPLEAALTELLPRGYEEGERRVPGRIEAAVLAGVRERAATVAVPLLRPDAELSSAEETERDRAMALFDHCDAELRRIADDDTALREALQLERTLRGRRAVDSERTMRNLVMIAGWSFLIGGWW